MCTIDKCFVVIDVARFERVNHRPYKKPIDQSFIYLGMSIDGALTILWVSLWGLKSFLETLTNRGSLNMTNEACTSILHSQNV